MEEKSTSCSPTVGGDFSLLGVVASAAFPLCFLWGTTLDRCSLIFDLLAIDNMCTTASVLQQTNKIT